MSSEVEAGGILGAASLLRRARPHQAAATRCANCETPLQGPWCYACGQLGADFHRSTAHLALESVEGLFHLDSRLWRTLPDLLVRPARLTRAYLEGRRAPQIPPFRLFLVVVLLVFATAGLQQGGKGEGPRIVQMGVDAKPAAGKVRAELGGNGALERWFETRATLALERPEELKLRLEAWGERAAVLALPLAAGLLALLFAFQRRFYFFDHLIFSMHSLSFQGLLLALFSVLRLLLGRTADVLLLAAPVHLFVHMRGVYATGVAGTLLRMALLAAGSLAAFSALMAGLVVIGLSGFAP